MSNAGPSYDDLLTLSAIGALDPVRDADVSAWNAAHPVHPKGSDGKWADTPGGAAAAIPRFSLPEGVSRQDYDRLVRINTHGYDATDADDAWADSLDWPTWVKERVEGEASRLTNEKWYLESLPGDLSKMPIDKLRERMAEHLRKTWAGKPIAVRLRPENLEAILKDGRFKTQFETGTAGREASFMPTRRKDLEAAFFGIPHDADPSKRPVYGYVSVDPEHPRLDKRLNKYGPVAVMLKDSVRTRTTATVGDSADGDYGVLPSPVDNPSSVSANPQIVKNSIRRFPTSLDDGRGRDTLHPEFRANEYVEAQIHGGVSVDDIAEVVFLEKPSETLTDQLKKAGIPWKVSAPPAGERGASLRELVAREVLALLRSDVDDDPIGELDDETVALLQAMHELEQEAGAEGRAFDPKLHQRWPKGTPLAGKFRPMVDLLKMAIAQHDGKGHPFELFNREQLRKAAKARGITLKTGEDKDSIAAKLLADLGGPVKGNALPAPAVKVATPGPKVTTKPFAGSGAFIDKKSSFTVEVDGAHVGAVHEELGGGWTAIPTGKSKPHWTPPPPGATKDQAVQSLVAADAAAKTTPAVPVTPAIPGVKLKKVKQVFAVAPDAYEVNFNGGFVGHVHGNEADPNAPWVPFRPANASWNLLDPGGKSSKEAAIKELVDSYEAAHPKAAPALKVADIPSDVRKAIFDGYKAQPKGQLLHSPASESFDNLVAVAHVYGGKVPGGVSPKLAAQIVDEQLSKNQAIANHQLLEKKLADWLATADGKTYALANTTPKKSIVESLTGKVTTPDGVKLAVGEKVQKLGGPGKFNAKQTDFKGHTASQMQNLQDQYMTANGLKWDTAQRAALKNYTGGGYTPMNNYLRGKHSGSNSLTKKQVLDVQSTMMPLQEHAQLIRGTGWDQLPKGFQSVTEVQKLVGKTIEEPAFMSTSVAGAGGHFSQKPVKLIIEAPAGTNGVFVKSISMHPGENEFLLAAGQKFRVMEVVPASSGGKATIKLRVVTPK